MLFFRIKETLPNGHENLPLFIFQRERHAYISKQNKGSIIHLEWFFSLKIKMSDNTFSNCLLLSLHTYYYIV